MFEKSSLGIVFEPDGTLRVAELTSNLRTVTLSRTWTLHPGGEDVFDCWGQALEQLRGTGVDLENAVIGIPDSLVYRKHLSFPFRNRKRIMQILNSELDGEIPLPVDEVVADLIPGQSDGAGLQGVAMACDRNTFSRFLDLFAPPTRLKSVQTSSLGIAGASLRAGMSDGVTVSCGKGEAMLIEFRSSRVKTVKRLALTGDGEGNARLLVEMVRQHTVDGDKVLFGCGEMLDPVRAELDRDGTLILGRLSGSDNVQVAAGVDQDTAPYAAAVGLALAGLGMSQLQPFDLRQGPFKQITTLAGLRGPIIRASALVLLVAALGMVSLLSSLHQARGEYQNLQGELTREFTELFPGSRLLDGQEAAQIKAELDELRKRMEDMSGLEGRGALSILAELSAAVPEDVSLKLEELSYDSNKLRFEGSVSSFDAVDRIKAALDEDPLFSDVQVQNARVGANINKVTFRLQMEVR